MRSRPCSRAPWSTSGRRPRPSCGSPFDASVDEANRPSHLDANSGVLRRELNARLSAEALSVEKVDVIAAKIPVA